MTNQPEFRIRMAELTGNRKRPFRISLDPQGRAALAEDLGLVSLDAIEFKGELRPVGKSDVVLEARLKAKLAQGCVVTLAPVPAVIDQAVQRVYVPGMTVPEGDEIEMPEDDTREPMPEYLDLHEVLVEALALALPEYPRAPGAEGAELVFGPPGVEPMRDEALRPFAGLAALRDKLAE